MFNLVDLLSFGFFSQSRRCGTSVAEHKHHDAEYQHSQPPPQIHIDSEGTLKDALISYQTATHAMRARAPALPVLACLFLPHHFGQGGETGIVFIQVLIVCR